MGTIGGCWFLPHGGRRVEDWCLRHHCGEEDQLMECEPLFRHQLEPAEDSGYAEREGWPLPRTRPTPTPTPPRELRGASHSSLRIYKETAPTYPRSGDKRQGHSPVRRHDLRGKAQYGGTQPKTPAATAAANGMCVVALHRFKLSHTTVGHSRTHAPPRVRTHQSLGSGDHTAPWKVRTAVLGLRARAAVGRFRGRADRLLE